MRYDAEAAHAAARFAGDDSEKCECGDWADSKHFCGQCREPWCKHDWSPNADEPAEVEPVCRVPVHAEVKEVSDAKR